MMRSFLTLVSLALLSASASAQCTNGVCLVPQHRPIQQAVTWAADAVRGPVYGSTGVPPVVFSGVPQRMPEARRQPVRGFVRRLFAFDR